MSWKETDPMSERMRFVMLYQSKQRTMAGLCREFGISRRTGYKFVRRFEEEGVEGLKERSRAPHVCPRSTPAEVRDRIIRARKTHPTWGPRKLKAWLEDGDPTLSLPYPSTIGDLLKREGLTSARRRRPRPSAISTPGTEIGTANEEWDADFKGQFRLGNGEYCYPLTITDAYSRYLLEVRALQGTAGSGVRHWFEKAFREFGLPQTIRTDNGAPFAGTGLGRISSLSVWWLKLGICPVRGRPHHPQDNGRHERMHRTLKAETTRPPSRTEEKQQQRFNEFRREYNEERPHEALGQRPPARIYGPSARSYPRRTPDVEYPLHYEVRSVMKGGCFRWHSQAIFVSECLVGERVGLVEIDDELWRVYFGALELGVLDEAEARGHRTGKVLPMSPV